MFIIRDIFNTKPGKAKELVAKFKKATPHFKKIGAKEVTVMTDTVAGYWTVVVETQVEEMGNYFNMANQRSPEVEEAMKGYMDLLNGGHREIFKVE